MRPAHRPAANFATISSGLYRFFGFGPPSCKKTYCKSARFNGGGSWVFERNLRIAIGLQPPTSHGDTRCNLIISCALVRSLLRRDHVLQECS